MLVTGGSGYLGGWVVKLAAATWDVTATYATQGQDTSRADWHHLDIRDPAAVSTLVAELHPDVIVHTAALNPGQGDDFAGINITGTHNVARAAAATHARLIHMSTDVLFDGKKGNYVEQDPPGPLTTYAKTKAGAEIEVLESGADAVIVRTSLVYGWRPTVARAARWIIDAVESGEILSLWSDELRCPIWVESLAAALVELAGLDYTGFLHIAGDQVVSRYEFGLALLSFAGIDTSDVLPATSPPGALRPLDCSMDCSLARSLLATPLPAIDEVLARGDAIR
jgi:dTDP-4-dehydrorhamnose reductase